MDRSVQITCIRNPFDPMVSRVIRSFPQGQTISEYSGHFFPAVPEGLDLCISVNGHILEGGLEAVYVPRAGDSIAFCAVPKGGGGGGKSILRMVAMLALVAVAPALVGALGAAGVGGLTTTVAGVTTLTATGTFVAGGIVVAGGLLINSIFPPKLPQFDGSKGLENSRTYGWNAAPNAAEVGAALPELFGTFRVTPTLLSRYIELDGDKQYLNMLFAIAGHEIDGVDFESIRINKQPISNFVDVIPNVRLGTNDQDSLPYFSDSRSDVPLSVPLSTDWTTRQTNAACDALSVALIAPAGLWEAKNDGSLGAVTVTIEAEYRQVGDPDWVGWLGNTGFLPGPRFRDRLSDTRFRVNNDIVGEWGDGFPSIPVTTEDKVRYRVGTAIRALHAGGYTEHNVLSTSVSYVSLGGGRHQIVTVVTVDGTLPADMTGFEWAPPYELSAAQNSAKRWMVKLEEPYAGLAQYEYRFRFALAPTSGNRFNTGVYLDFHQEIVREAFTYPNTALLSLRALATDQLSGGQPRVDVVVRRSTVPVWTGAAYEDKPATNPAWVNYHQLHDSLSGGGIPASRIVYDAFEAFAAWCDERGFTCNIYFDSAMNLKQAMDTVSMLGRGQVTQVGSKFTVMVDKPDTAVQRFLFTMGNVQTDSLAEEWLPGEERADEVEVTFWNAENEYERDTVTVYQAGYDSLTGGTNKQSITLYGCTDRVLAAKYGQFLLNKNRYLTLTGSWGADIDALGCLPGDVVDIAHDVPQWGYSGRVVSATANTVTLDREVTLDPGVSYAVEVKLADDSREMKTLSVETGITTDTLTLPSNWTTTPEKYDLYSFGPVNQHVKSFRVLEITKTSELRRRLKCLEYVEEIYDDAADIPVPPPSLLGTVAGFRAVEAWTVSSDGSGRSVVDLTWRGGDLSWNIYMRLGADGPWERIDTAHSTVYRITEPLAVGETYGFAVSALSPEAGTSASVTILGKWWPPSDVQNLLAVPQSNGIKVSWDKIADIDCKEYVLKEGSSWAAAAEIARVRANSFLWEIKPAGSYTFWIAAVDSQGQESENPASFALSINVPSVSAVTPTTGNGVLRLSWEQSVGQFPIVEYIVSIGSVYETALEVTRVKSTIVSFLVNWSETRRYWVTPVDSAGNLGTASSVDVYIIPPGPPVNIVPQVIYNNALVRWEEPSTHSLPIDYYLLKKGAVLETAVSLGELYATFAIQQELQGGAYTYWIAAVDTAGNIGTWASVSVTVDAPQGFVLRTDEYLDLASPTDSSAVTTTESGGVLGPVVTGETWAQHFTNNSWASPDDQVQAGFPFYMQPAAATGYWEKEIDMGALLPGSRVTVTPDISVLDGTPDWTIDISVSDDGIAWTDFTDTLEVFASAFQYINVRVNMTSDSPETGLLVINALRLTISLTKKADSGRVQALSTDANGTAVSFNEDFIDVNSIGLTVESTDAANAVLEFSDTPYPTEFKVRVFDNSGNRLTRYVNWNASGV